MTKLQKILIPYLTRSFVGVGYLFGSKIFRKIIDGWFKQLEWAFLITALFIIGIRTPYPISDFFILLGIISGILMAIYSYNFLIDDIQIEFRVSIEEVNKKNEKLFLNSKIQINPYQLFPSLSATFPLLLILLIINLITFFAIFTAFSVFY